MVAHISLHLLSNIFIHSYYVSLLINNQHASPLLLLPPCATSSATTLTALHFSFTAGVGILTAYLSNDKREVPKVPFWDLLAFSLVANGSVVAMNLSLMLNTVGFYQV